MTKIKFKVEADDLEDVDKDSGDFVVPPKGYYIFAIKEANAGFSKTDGVEDKKKPRLEVILQIVGVGRDGEAVTENYGNVWDYISFSKESGWKRGEFLWALGLIDNKEDTEIEVDTDELVGQQVLGRIKHQKDNREDGAVQAKIAKYLRATDSDGEAAFGAAAADEEGGGDVFGGEETTAPEYLTEEGLNELEMKELGATAKEFDIDPNDHLVKVKGKVDLEATKAAVIAAILEAQGAPGDEPEADAGGDDEESPF